MINGKKKLNRVLLKLCKNFKFLIRHNRKCSFRLGNIYECESWHI